MPTKEEFIQEIARISRSEMIDEKTSELSGLLPSLLHDNALEYFNYTGDKNNRKDQIKHVVDERKKLEGRFDEINDLGYSPANLSVVKIDKLLKKLDWLLTECKSTSLMVEACSDNPSEDDMQPAQVVNNFVLPKIATAYTQANNNFYFLERAIENIEDEPFSNIQSILQKINETVQDLENLIESVKHVALKRTLKNLILDPVNRDKAENRMETSEYEEASKRIAGLKYTVGDLKISRIEELAKKLSELLAINSPSDLSDACLGNYSDVVNGDVLTNIANAYGRSNSCISSLENAAKQKAVEWVSKLDIEIKGLEKWINSIENVLLKNHLTRVFLNTVNAAKENSSAYETALDEIF